MNPFFALAIGFGLVGLLLEGQAKKPTVSANRLDGKADGLETVKDEPTANESSTETEPETMDEKGKE